MACTRHLVRRQGCPPPYAPAINQCSTGPHLIAKLYPQDFLKLFADVGVLRTEADFHDLAAAYLERAAAANVRHAEMAFDPQGHINRWEGAWRAASSRGSERAGCQLL
jgi:hypothetical protein